MKKFVTALTVLANLSTLTATSVYAGDGSGATTSGVHTLDMQALGSVANATSQKAIANPVGLDTQSIHAGDEVFVRYQDIHAESASLSYQSRVENFGKPVAPREKLNPYTAESYKSTRILRTWFDYQAQRQKVIEVLTNEFLKNPAYKAELLSEAKMTRESGRASSMKDIINKRANKYFLDRGIKALLPNQFEVATSRSTYSSIYDVSDLALTKEVTSGLFETGERVFFPKIANGEVVYDSGTVVGIMSDGDVIVRKGGLFATRILAEDLISQKSKFEASAFEIGEEVNFKFRTETGSYANLERTKNGLLASRVTTVLNERIDGALDPSKVKTNFPSMAVQDVRAKVVGFSPKGDILILVSKNGNRLRIEKNKISQNINKITGSNVIQFPVLQNQAQENTCSKLFN